MNNRKFIRLHAYSTIEQGYGHVRVIFNGIEIENDQETRPMSEIVNGIDCDGLEISCQQDKSSGADAYAFEVQYRNVYALRNPRAQRVAKSLNKIERGLDKLNQDLGYPQTFGEYCSRVAKVVKADAFKIVNEECSKASFGTLINRLVTENIAKLRAL